MDGRIKNWINLKNNFQCLFNPIYKRFSNYLIKYLYKIILKITKIQNNFVGKGLDNSLIKNIFLTKNLFNFHL